MAHSKARAALAQKLAVVGMLVIPFLGLLMLAKNSKPKLSGSGRSRAVWLALKKPLTGKDGQEVFQRDLKGRVLPGLVGTLIRVAPSELVVGILDERTPEVRLELWDEQGNRAQLKEPLKAGAVVEFSGEGVALEQNPFLLTVKVAANLGPVGTQRR